MDDTLRQRTERLIADCELGSACVICPTLRDLVQALTDAEARVVELESKNAGLAHAVQDAVKTLDAAEARAVQAEQERDRWKREAEIETGYRRSAMETHQLLTDRASVAERRLAEAEQDREAQRRQDFEAGWYAGLDWHRIPDRVPQRQGLDAAYVKHLQP